MPLFFGAAALTLWWSIGRGRDWMPFLFTLVIFALTMVGLAISMRPDVIPGRVSIWEAAAPESRPLFMLVGPVVLIPLHLGYTPCAFWVLSGKAREAGYYREVLTPVPCGR